MFARKAEVVTVDSGVEQPQRRRLTREQENDRRAAVLEQRLNTPSSFATRRAAAVPDVRQLVFMDTTEQTVTRGMHDVHHEVVEVELWCDKRHPTRTYYRVPGGVLQATYDTSGKTDDVSTLPPLKAKPRLAGSYPDAPADPPARPV